MIISILVPDECFRIEGTKEHKFKPGDICILHGLEAVPQYNGTEVTITSAREDGKHGRAYYIKGDINAELNWVYEYRLRLKQQ